VTALWDGSIQNPGGKCSQNTKFPKFLYDDFITGSQEEQNSRAPFSMTLFLKEFVAQKVL
jgi:hypothetical protein